MSVPRPYFVTGPDDTGEVHPRLEIRDLAKNPEQFSLFIQAWLNIRNPSGDTPLAAQHVQIGGIHGLPYVRWPGDPGGETDIGANWQGYCNHASVLFPSWHRPYVMLIEQSIFKEAQAIVKRQGLGPKWAQAANELRFPFWDWTAPETGKEGLPKILSQPTLDLLMPDGSTSTVDNILAFYEFGLYNAYFAEWTRTYRWPDGAKNNVVEDYAKLNSTLTDSRSTGPASYKNILAQVAQIFTYPLTSDRPHTIWDQFSNTRGQSKSTHNFRLTSLEQPHNVVHLVVGGSGGHMMDNDYAGFDPIFFLHHCNVDRLLAFWEYVYPSYWVGKDGYETPSGAKPFTQADGTFAEANNAIVNELTPLEPYRKPDGSYWTANDTRFVGKSPFPKYYTYPPIDGVSVDKPATATQRAQYLRALQKHFGQKPTVQRDNQIAITQSLFTSNSEESLPPKHEPVFNFRQFVITVELVEHAFEGSHILEVSYTSKDGETYDVGGTAVLGRTHGTQCRGCQERRRTNSRVHDTIHIPHDVTVKIIADHNLNHTHISDDELCNTIRDCFSAKIASPGGTTRAHATPGARSLQNATPVDENVLPKLRLASANVCAIRDDNENIEHPWEFYDWKDHGPILENEWVIPQV